MARYRPAGVTPQHPSEVPKHAAPAVPAADAARSGTAVWPWVLVASALVALAAMAVAFRTRARRGAVAL